MRDGWRPGAALVVALAASPALAQHAPPDVLEAAAAQQRAERERAAREQVTALLHGKKVTVEYGRPALRGRTMDQLIEMLPPHRVWRAGADQATRLTTESDILVGGQRVPAGSYTLYVHLPREGAWQLIVSSDRGVPLKTIYPPAPPELADELWPRLEDYPAIASREVARIPLRRVPAAEPMDRFLIGLTPARDGVSGITLTWGDQSWTAEIRPAG